MEDQSTTFEQLPEPQPSKSWLVPTLVIALVLSTTSTLFFAYQYFKSSPPEQPKQQQTIKVQASPTPDLTSNWQTYSNKNLGISFKHPKSIQVSDAVLSDPFKGDIQIGRLITISPYEDRLLSEYYQKNPEIIQINNEIPPIIINGQEYEFIKSVWEDGGGDQGNQQLTYLIDIPEKVSIDLRFQKIVHFDDPSLDYMQVTTPNGNFIKIDQSEIDTALQILSTLEFTNKLEKKLVYIKSITPAYDMYEVQVDYIDIIDDPSEPNGYKISNPSLELTTLPIETNATVTLQTYSLAKDGNFNYNQLVSFNDFVNSFNSSDVDSSIKNALYWIETRYGTIVNITERYTP